MKALDVKGIRREIPRPIDREIYMVKVDELGVTLKVKRGRKGLPTVTWEQVWKRAMEMSAEEMRQERAREREMKRAVGR